MRVYRVILLAVLSSLLGLFMGDVNRPALAADTSGGSSAGVIWAGVQAGTPPRSGSSGGSACTWRMLVTFDSSIGRTTNISRVVSGIRYDLYERRCGAVFTDVWIPRLSPSQLARSAAVSAQARLPAPVANFAPVADSVVVKLPVWFWVESSWWTPVSATAWIPTALGTLWARTTATPVRVKFWTQDDASPDGPGTGSTSCAGPGRPWQVALGDEAVSACSYTFAHSSGSRPSGRFVGVVGVEWRISWTSSTGAGGMLPSHTTASFVTTRVGELQALVG